MLSKLQPAGAFVSRHLNAPKHSLKSKLSNARRAFLAVSRNSKKLRSNRSSVTTSSTSPPVEKCFVTTPIYYVNDQPHIGHVYTSTIADAYARFQRSRGRDVFFLTGTDEHGLKVEQSAQKRGISPQELADENSATFRQVLDDMGITFDGFIRTTEPYHKSQVQHFVDKLREKGDVYLGKFEGWYDEGQEEYYTETKAKELDYKSPVSGKDMARSSEENYYFKLSAYQRQLEKLHEECPDFLSPPARRNEILSRLSQGLNDVPISRTNFKWGIAMPNDDNHIIYVWIDALLNYITALGLAEEPSQPAASAGVATRRLKGELKDYWPASLHIMAKEISWFHAVIWPALLMALEMPLPERVHAHGFWIRDGKKMSKSLGNFVDLKPITRYTDHYGLDIFACARGV
jgi:methionyl-tRNA synthetase